MYQQFRWTPVGEDENHWLRLNEPLQPYVFTELAMLINADTFVDVGANIGAYSVFMASLDCVKEVHSFEPSPETFKQLERHVRLNNLAEKVTTYNLAATATDAELQFGVVSEVSGSNGVLATTYLPKEKYKTILNVKGVPLDDVLAPHGQAVCVKIDVEGHERQVIAGAGRLLRNNTCVVQIEAFDASSPGIAAALTELGFERLCSVGSDSYFSNVRPTLPPSEIVAVHERATRRLINSNVNQSLYPGASPKPVRVKLFRGLAVEVSGPVAQLYRKQRYGVHQR